MSLTIPTGVFFIKNNSTSISFTLNKLFQLSRSDTNGIIVNCDTFTNNNNLYLPNGYDNKSSGFLLTFIPPNIYQEPNNVYQWELKMYLEPLLSNYNITPDAMDFFYNYHKNDLNFQQFDLNLLDNMIQNRKFDWNNCLPSNYKLDIKLNDFKFTPCEFAIGTVITDCIVIAIGAYPLIGKLRANTINEILKLSTNMISQIETIVLNISSTNIKDQLNGIWNILMVIKNGGNLGAIVSAIFNDLKWWDMILYGVTSLATITLLFTTDGVAFLAETALFLTSTGFFASHIIDATQKCSKIDK